MIKDVCWMAKILVIWMVFHFYIFHFSTQIFCHWEGSFRSTQNDKIALVVAKDTEVFTSMCEKGVRVKGDNQTEQLIL